MSNQFSYYAVYESDDSRGYDADYTPFLSKEGAIRAAESYLEFSSGPNDVVFVVAVPHAVCVTNDDEWTLWDHMDEIEASAFTYLHCGNERDRYGAAAGESR